MNSNPIRLLVVDDSALARRLNARGLGIAANGCPDQYLTYIDFFGNEGFPFSINYARRARQQGLRGILGEFTMQQAPGTLTWSIGDIGPQHREPMPTSGGPKGPDLPTGQIDSPGRHVPPGSLYLQQLYERLGPEALRNIGYDPSRR